MRTIPAPSEEMIRQYTEATIRIAEDEFSMDTSKENVIRFIRHQAYVKAQMDAEITWLRGFINTEGVE